jgi:hypothetical protein
MVRCSRILPALLLAVALASGAVLADPVSALGPRRSEMTALAPKDVLLRLWDRLSSLWSKNGCQIDPNGLCKSAPAPATGDNGCGIDPSGQCGH